MAFNTSRSVKGEFSFIAFLSAINPLKKNPGISTKILTFITLLILTALLHFILEFYLDCRSKSVKKLKACNLYCQMDSCLHSLKTIDFKGNQ